MFSQHVAGSLNVVADSLSRDSHLSTDQLTFLYFHLCPDQITNSFRISTLPRDVTSWLSILARKLPVIKALKREPTRSTLARGPDGSNLLATSGSRIRSWTESRSSTKGASSAPSCTPSGQELSINVVAKRWRLQPLARPSITYVRPSRQVIGPTRD